MRTFQGTSETRRQLFMSAFRICTTVPLTPEKEKERKMKYELCAKHLILTELPVSRNSN